MKRLLHIIATPREDESRTLQISNVFLEAFQSNHPNWVVDELDLCKENLPSLSAKSVNGKYVLLNGEELYGSLKETWIEIIQQVERFKTADQYLISTPMWNFCIPYMLKQYIDVIVQPRHLFQYKEDGSIEGLVKGKKMVVISTRGGNYSGNKKSFDFQEPYLRTIFNFVGIEEIQFIHAEPMDKGDQVRKKKISEAQKLARQAGLDA